MSEISYRGQRAFVHPQRNGDLVAFATAEDSVDLGNRLFGGTHRPIRGVDAADLRRKFEAAVDAHLGRLPSPRVVTHVGDEHNTLGLVDVDAAIAFLNEAAALDPAAIGTLVRHRVPCLPAVGDHPTIQASAGEDGQHRVGFLGLLNGLFGVIQDGPHAGWGRIACIVEADGTVSGFHRTDARAKE